MHYRCTQCDWSKTAEPSSDCLTPGLDYFDTCPKCGNAPLQSERVKSSTSSMPEVFKTIEKWLKL